MSVAWSYYIRTTYHNADDGSADSASTERHSNIIIQLIV